MFRGTEPLRAGGFTFGAVSTTGVTEGGTPKAGGPSATHQDPEHLCVLGTADETSDVILEVEGRELHANRAVLAHYSPVFRKMFFSDFKEKTQTKVPLPGKGYDVMAKFFNVLYSHSPGTSGLISDEDLVTLLTLADEYQADQVKARCQDYIGDQLSKHYRSSHVASKPGARAVALYGQSTFPLEATFRGNRGFGNAVSQFCYLEYPEHTPSCSPYSPCSPCSPWISRLTLYLWMCDQHRLPRHRAEVMSLLVKELRRLDDVAEGEHYPSLPLQSRVDLLEALCRKLAG